MTPGSGPFAITTSEDGSVWIGKPEYRRMYCRDKLDARQFEALCSEMNVIHQEAYAAGQAAERARMEGLLRRSMKWWEPDCKAEDCDKGWHVERLTDWTDITAALAALDAGSQP